MPLALAVVAFGQTQPPAAPESAEHKYARQAVEAEEEAWHKRADDTAQQVKAASEQSERDCGPLDTRVLLHDSNAYSLGPRYDGSFLGPPPPSKHEKGTTKEALANYEVRKNACLADLKKQADLSDTSAYYTRVPVPDWDILKTLKFRLDHADDCAAIYRKTIDEKAADITTREAEQIKVCKDADLYPPGK
jgi:hypothetical protein